MKVAYHVYRDYNLRVTCESEEEIFRNPRYAKTFAKYRYSFVAMRWHPRRKKLFVGTTNSGGDLLLEFAPGSGRFRSCGYAESGIWEDTESKIHKGIWLDGKEDALYFGTSTLRPIPVTIHSRGGKLVRYRIAERRFDLIAAPTPGDFYQATGYDPRRKKMYMYTRPGSCFAVYDMRKRKLLRHDFVGSIPHIGCIDDDGGVWGTYGIGRHGFFRYLPRTDSYEFPPDCILPDASQAADVMYSGAGPVDSFINGGDGYLYAGSALGEMIRIDPLSKTIKYLGKPVPGRRLPGMTLAEDGCIYMCGGSDNAPMLARYNRRSERFELLGGVAAKDGTTCYRCHELVVADGTAYIGETDNKNRSGYLWACAIR